MITAFSSSSSGRGYESRAVQARATRSDRSSLQESSTPSGSRAEILAALRRFQGAIVLVTHDEGAVDALSPERVVLLPDGVEDAWSEELADLVALA